MAEYTDLLKQYMGLMPSPEQLKGLLAPQQTQLQAGLLGAAQALQPYMGYTTTPTTFGQAAAAGLTGAAGGIQEKQQSDLARALQGLNVYSAIKDVTEKEKPLSTIGKLSYDLEQGNISKEEYNTALKDYYGTNTPTKIQEIQYMANAKGISEGEVIDLMYSTKTKSEGTFVRDFVQDQLDTMLTKPEPGTTEYKTLIDNLTAEGKNLYGIGKELDLQKDGNENNQSTDPFTIGQTTVKDGITYQYKGNDQWEQVD